jgi:hypothetical protein
LSYYGALDNSNTGPNGGNNSVPGNATQYIPDTTSVGGIDFSKNDFHLYPNPATNFLQLKTNASENVHARVINATGQILINEKLRAEDVKLDISGLPQSIYILQVLHSNGNSVYSSRFLKE